MSEIIIDICCLMITCAISYAIVRLTDASVLALQTVITAREKQKSEVLELIRLLVQRVLQRVSQFDPCLHRPSPDHDNLSC